jgi:hypothetical protein
VFDHVFPGLIAFVLAAAASPQPQQLPDAQPATSTQPTTQPAPRDAGYRKPMQARELEPLLRGQEARPVLPTPVSREQELAGSRRAAESALFLDGEPLVDRPGRLIRRGERSEFVFRIDDASQKTVTLELHRNQLLEAMEDEADHGLSEFIVSGEITRYRGTNGLLLRKVLRRVSNGNVGP